MIGNIRGVVATLLGGAALLLTAGTAARAQFVDPALKHDFALKVGVFIPSDRDVRRAGGTYNFSVEGDAVIQRFPERSFVSIASVGYIERGDFRMTPLTLSQVYRDPANKSSYNYFYGYGLGLYPTRLKAGDPGDGNVKTLFGGFILTGIDLSDNTLVEIKYSYLSKYNSKFVGGLQLSLGRRF